MAHPVNNLARAFRLNTLVQSLSKIMSGETQFDRQDPQPAIMAQRLQTMQDWLNEIKQLPQALVPLAGDASFRRYFRLKTQDGKQRVVMDAPPQRESCATFVDLAQLFAAHKVGVPTIYAQDLSQGFLLLHDFGDRLYLSELNKTTAEDLYKRAFVELFKIQRVERSILAEYNEGLFLQEMQLFSAWYLGEYKKQSLSEKELATLMRLFALLIESAKQQPQVCVHRDFHSRNLLILDDGGVGVLDFQDAVWGPITYDIVSLLKDCYIDWPPAQRAAWLWNYYQELPPNLRGDSFEQFMRWFDWMGLQRHLKCLGIFSRLHIRDHKSGYLVDIPRVLNYAREVAQSYEELNDLLPFLV